MKDEVTAVPRYGLVRKLDHVYEEKFKMRLPSLQQLLPLIGMVLRYLIYYIKCKWKGITPLADFFITEQAKQIYGVPIGGIGAGSIGRGYKGEFCRYQLRPGIYEYETIDANQFIITIKDANRTTILQSLLSTYRRESKTLQAWKNVIDGSKCTYTGLYPRSWTEYDLSEYGVKLICRQISPVMPYNYKDTSLPCAVFVWSIENVSNEKLHVTITFTFKNGIGNKKLDTDSTCSSKPFSFLDSEGVILYHVIDRTPCSYALATRSGDNQISKSVYFDPNSDGSELWEQLYKDGRLSKISDNRFDNQFGEMGVALAVQVEVPPNNVKDLEFGLVWDMPSVTFGNKGRKYSKYYTSIFGSDAALKIVDYALKMYEIWEVDIYKWQETVLNDCRLPDWYKSALFNETYFVSDGGSIWCTLDESEKSKLSSKDPRLTYGRFAYLEGHEYRMYNTYDVHFYASFALALNWPKLQEVIQYDYRDAIFSEIPLKITAFDGDVTTRKVRNSVPHDLGDPGEEPFVLINSYPLHDVSEWRDLNSKFVLQVFRDYSLNPDGAEGRRYLEDMYEALVVVMEKSRTFDTDFDGLIDNSNNADQTFDTWIMSGPSAYCAGLWLASVYAMTVIARLLNKPVDQDKFEKYLDRAKKSFDRKLWNGKFFNYDTSLKHGGTIMADQMCAHWYLRCCGYKYEVYDQTKITSALRTVYENNVMSFCNGTMGAVNGFKCEGQVDVCSLQSDEVWTGVTYALSSLMLYEGMTGEAWKTSGGMYECLTRHGLAFQTPEAITQFRGYRSLGYMRPLIIWSMQLALKTLSDE